MTGPREWMEVTKPFRRSRLQDQFGSLVLMWRRHGTAPDMSCKYPAAAILVHCNLALLLTPLLRFFRTNAKLLTASGTPRTARRTSRSSKTGQCPRMVTHHWSNRFRDLLAAVLADALNLKRWDKLAERHLVGLIGFLDVFRVFALSWWHLGSSFISVYGHWKS